MGDLNFLMGPLPRDSKKTTQRVLEQLTASHGQELANHLVVYLAENPTYEEGNQPHITPPRGVAQWPMDCEEVD